MTIALKRKLTAKDVHFMYLTELECFKVQARGTTYVYQNKPILRQMSWAFDNGPHNVKVEF